MKRREFITLLGGAAAWPLAARAQQPDRMRRIGVLMSTAADDAVGRARLAAFHQAMQQMGWSEGRNLRIDTRWGTNDTNRDRKFAEELVALAPDVILSATGRSPFTRTGRAGRSPRRASRRQPSRLRINFRQFVGDDGSKVAALRGTGSPAQILVRTWTKGRSRLAEDVVPQR